MPSISNLKITTAMANRSWSLVPVYARVAGSVWAAVHVASWASALGVQQVQQFGGRVFGAADQAGEGTLRRRFGVLERVAVDDGDEAVGWIDEDVVVVDVADDGVNEVESVHRLGEVADGVFRDGDDVVSGTVLGCNHAFTRFGVAVGPDGHEEFGRNSRHDESD